MKVNVNGRIIQVVVSKIYQTEDVDTFLNDRDIPKDLRKESFRRWFSKAGDSKKKVLIDTVCHINSHEETSLGVGLALQHPDAAYDKWKGKKISFKRAIDQAACFNKSERSLLWSEFIKKYMGKKGVKK
jgi:hypothetical protein